MKVKRKEARSVIQEETLKEDKLVLLLCLRQHLSPSSSEADSDGEEIMSLLVQGKADAVTVPEPALLDQSKLIIC